MGGKHSTPTKKRTARGGRLPVWALILSDILLTGFVLCVFACFHHVIPRLKAPSAEAPKPVSVVVSTPAPTPSPQAEEEEEPDNRTEWQKRFEEHFTDEIISTENSYSSPSVSITVSTYTTEFKNDLLTYHVADIYIGQIDNFRTYLATGEFKYYGCETPVGIDQSADAIIAINGDYCNNQYTGLLVRNGELFMSEQTTSDICVLYRDGSIETYRPEEYKVDDILAKEPWQVWKFGPKLLDDNGQPCTDFNTGDAIKWDNPRSGLGYYEPGHYCFVVVDGRQPGYSRGIEIDAFAQLFADLGCVRAYNMDGGASAVMTFNDAVYSRPSNGGRDLGDILLIREIDAAAAEEVE